MACLPCAADCALEEISRTAPPISRTASTALRVEAWIMKALFQIIVVQ